MSRECCGFPSNLPVGRNRLSRVNFWTPSVHPVGRKRFSRCTGTKVRLVRQSTSFTSMGSLVRVQLSPPLGSPCRSRASTFLSPRHHRRGVHFFQGSPRRRERLGPPFRSHGRLAQLPENRGGSVGGINGISGLIFLASSRAL